MNDNFGYIDIVLLAIVAGIIILRLRNVLGKGAEDGAVRAKKSVAVDEINSWEKEMLSRTKNVQTLLDEEAVQKMYNADEKVINERRNYITKVKVIALDSLGYAPLTNPSTLRQKEKNRIMDSMRLVMDTLSEEELTRKFNDICDDKIFDPKCDYSNYPVYDA